MKKLFKNYNFEFTKNERKLLTTFCKQTLRQISGDNKFFAEQRAFNSILDKLNSEDEQIKLTKDEATRLQRQLEQNVQHLKKEMKKSWFIKKWLYKSMLNQYDGILDHFKG